MFEWLEKKLEKQMRGGRGRRARRVALAGGLLDSGGDWTSQVFLGAIPPITMYLTSWC